MGNLPVPVSRTSWQDTLNPYGKPDFFPESSAAGIFISIADFIWYSLVFILIKKKGWLFQNTQDEDKAANSEDKLQPGIL
ncbi:MAG: hypothetical protein JW901_11060 [Dehalococcoidia bacterium]|nr:hypothetical protein [Dehalococcoidia bacterium]